MHYITITVWIFTSLLLAIFLMILFPSRFVIGAGTLIVPLLIAYQAYVVLKAKEPEIPPSEEDRWYEH